MIPSGVAVATLLMALGPAASQAQSVCAQGRIGEIVIERLEVFDASEGSSDGLLFRLGNAIHVSTVESFVRSELLFEPGDCFDPFLITESERVLRSRAIIKEATITSEPAADGTLSVRVLTQDDWSLGVSLGISFDEGLKFEGIGVTEQNFLGRGIVLGVTRSEDREFREIGGKLGAARLAGTNFQLSAASGETRVGPFLDERLERPFLSEVGRFAIRQELVLREDYFAWSAGEASGLSHVLAPYDRRVFALTGMYRGGVPGGLLMLGAGISRHELRHSGPGALESVDDDFDSPVPALQPEQDQALSQLSTFKATRANFLLGFRRVSYAVRSRLDGVSALQDVQVGSEGILTVGRSVGFLSGTGDADDLHGRFDLFAGAAPGPVVVNANAFVEGRRGFGDDPAAGNWRDVMAQADGSVYWQPAVLADHTLVGRVQAAGAWRMDRPFQLTGGGREGVRGYSRDAFPGARRVLVTLEDRSILYSGTGIDVGLAAFTDLGRVWAGKVPFGVDSGWRTSLGLGFRISAPGGALRATRFDFTLPLSGDRDTQGVYFRFYTELGALLRAPNRRGQVERSRWSGVDADLTVRPTN